MTDDTPHIPHELDDGLAFAYGEETAVPPSASVIERIGEITGSKPQVLLRDDRAGDLAVVKPLGPDDRLEAGKYVVHGELGRGGVGTVHRGHDQDLGRDVAMKFLHEKYKDEPQILHRFVEEAQIGGQLQHPGIVPVYDLGMLDGKPFFSMKLVKGQTLAKKLADRESSSDHRRTFLAIFEDVCQTLAYAHVRGVVHRDLKPANIMIGSFGEVQVVDWGMGKVMQQGGVADEQLAAERRMKNSVIETVRSSGHGTHSLVGSVMGTPAYMPPEQARGDVAAMDERSDVFALGAILCEILTGQPPYVGEPDDLVAVAAMAKLDDAYARLEACDGEPEMIDLATRCLMPAPSARPKSAEVVAKAVHDHLAAVEARVHEARVEAAEARVRATALKRTQKLGMSVTAVIAAGLLVSLWFWRAAEEAVANEGIAREAALASEEEARENERLAGQQTEIATRELARTVEIKSLLTEMLRSVDPELAMNTPGLVLLLEILDAAAQRLAENAIEDEVVYAELNALIGAVYLSIGMYPEAEWHLTVALEVRSRVLGEEHRDTLASRGDLAALYEGEGRYGEAETLYLETVEIRKRLLGEEHPDTLASLGNLAALFTHQDRYGEAEPLFLQTLETQKRVLGEEHPDTLANLGNLANLYRNQGRYSEAESLFLQTLEVEKRVLGEEHPDTLSRMSELALLYADQGRYREAETLGVQTLEINTRVLGEEHPRTLLSLGNLAKFYTEQGRYAAAEPLLFDALEIQKRALGEDCPLTLDCMVDLANLYRSLGRHGEAEVLLLRALELMRGLLGEEEAKTLSCRASLASVYKAQGRLAEAEALGLETLEIQKRVLGEEHPETLSSHADLAHLFMTQGRYDEAEPHYVKTLESLTRVLGEDHPGTLSKRADLAVLYMDQGRHGEAEAVYLETLQIQKRVLGEEHRSTLGTITNLGVLYNKMERFEDAVAMFEISLPIKRRVLGMGDLWTGVALNGLVTAYEGMGRTEDTRPLKVELLEVMLTLADDEGASARVLNEVAWRLLTHELEDLRDPERALGFARRACALAEEAGSDSLGTYLDSLALAQHETGDTAAAIETQRRALAVTPDGGTPDMTKRLAEYEAALRDR